MVTLFRPYGFADLIYFHAGAHLGQRKNRGFGVEAYLSNEVLRGIEAAQKKAERQQNRLCVHVGDEVYSVSKCWDTGFSVDLETVPKLRGLVDLFDGPRHMAQCLIIRADRAGDQMTYEFKRRTEACDKAPLDYERDQQAPIALLE